MKILSYPEQKKETLIRLIQYSYSNQLNRKISYGYANGLLHKHELPTPYPKGLFEALLDSGCVLGGDG